MSLGNKHLGKGISSLIGDYDGTSFEVEKLEEAGAKVLEIEIEKVRPNPNQPRKHFDEEALRDLSASIAAQGIIIPLIVEEVAKDSYVIVAGERRYRASKLAGLKTLPCIIRDFNDVQRMEVALIENIQRENLNPVEEARAYNYLLVQQEIKQEDLANRVGKSRSAIANSVRLLNLPPTMLDSLQNGEFSSGHARALLSVENPADREVLYYKILKDNLSVRQAEAQASDMNNGSRAVNKTVTPYDVKNKTKSDDIADVEEKFLSATGCHVELVGKVNKGKLVIRFKGTEELERIFQMMAPGQVLFDYEEEI